MRVRTANVADIPSILQLERESETAAHWSERQYADIFENVGQPARVVLLTGEQARVDGFLIARRVHEDWELENIVVSESARRRGLGSGLLQELIRLAREENGERISLEVRASNQTARAFYENHGFDQTGVRHYYYSGPREDAIVYQLKL